MSDEKELFIVGEYVKETEDGPVWDFAGVFDTREAAEAACVKDSYFVGPAPLNVPLPTDRVEWPDCYYPPITEVVK